MPEFAPSSARSPIVTRCVPPPERVPMIDAPPPISEPSPTTTPCEMRPSTIDAPSVPALKFTKPSCITVVPGARWAPSRTRAASAIRTPSVHKHSGAGRRELGEANESIIPSRMQQGRRRSGSGLAASASALSIYGASRMPSRLMSFARHRVSATARCSASRRPAVEAGLFESLHFRTIANQEYLKNGDLEKCINLYNNSLLYATYNSENYSIALANRSAVLLRMFQYEKSLEDIDLCLKGKYPTALKPKVYLRKCECFKILRDRENLEKTVDEFKLFINRELSDAIANQYNQKLEDLLSKDEDEVIRFDDDCLELPTMERNPEFEEMSVDVVLKLQLVLRIITKTCQQRGSLTPSPTKTKKSDKYSLIHDMDILLNNKNELQMCAEDAMFLVSYLKTKTNFFEYLLQFSSFKNKSEKDVKIAIGALIVRHLTQLRRTRLIIVDYCNLKGENRYSGIGIFSLFAYMNHKCDSNTMYYFHDDKVVIKALTDLEPNTKLTYSILMNHLDFMVERKTFLWDVCQIKCSCEHCLNPLLNMDKMDSFICIKCKGPAIKDRTTSEKYKCLSCNYMFKMPPNIKMNMMSAVDFRDGFFLFNEIGMAHEAFNLSKTFLNPYHRFFGELYHNMSRFYLEKGEEIFLENLFSQYSFLERRRKLLRMFKLYSILHYNFTIYSRQVDIRSDVFKYKGVGQGGRCFGNGSRIELLSLSAPYEDHKDSTNVMFLSAA
ncbi:hypothetical protein FQR65_LT19759 [Abscondita terminalis]|nr:hypothetical protein FQR65_LT19759 [Abscondita terminalis]